VIFGATGGQQYQPVRAYPLFSGFSIVIQELAAQVQPGQQESRNAI
jgi:hypothetical protein